MPITQLHCCHLLDYEHQLPSIILSHCHYSLKFGKGQDVKYDHQALERHILNRFIYGKPMIIVDNIPHVVYRKDIYTTSTFAEVRKKVEPQVCTAKFASKYHTRLALSCMNRRNYLQESDTVS